MSIICDVCGKEGAGHYRIQMDKVGANWAMSTDQYFCVDLCEEHAKFSKEEFVGAKKGTICLKSGTTFFAV